MNPAGEPFSSTHATTAGAQSEGRADSKDVSHGRMRVSKKLDTLGTVFLLNFGVSLVDMAERRNHHQSVNI
jgi:hypothetical protein